VACGLPVVATRCGGPEGIITDGTDGFLVPRDDAVALAARLQACSTLHTLNEALGRRARATIEARYAEEVAGEAFLEVWDRLLKQTDRTLMCVHCSFRECQAGARQFSTVPRAGAHAPSRPDDEGTWRGDAWSSAIGASPSWISIPGPSSRCSRSAGAT